MAITNGYITLAELKFALGIADATEDASLELAAEASSRAVDDFCGRRFFRDPDALQIRYYSPAHPYRLWIDDLDILTSLQTDSDGDGVFSETWTQDSEAAARGFRLEPLNAPADARPFTRVVVLSGALDQGNRRARLTGRFGWPAVPTAIRQATLLQAERLFKRKDAPFGVAGGTSGFDFGMVMIRQRLDPDVIVLCEAFRRVSVPEC